MPDLYRVGTVPWCWEYKCYSPYVVNPLLGRGSVQHGGCPSEADGWLFALGGTEERLTRTVLGVPARGSPAHDPPLDRCTGQGWVRETPAPDYADALAKGFGVTLLVAETTGAVSPIFEAMLRRLGRLSTAPGTTDYTSYGASPSSPGTFYRHHLAAHSAAIVHADATTILDKVAALSFFLCKQRPDQ